MAGTTDEIDAASRTADVVIWAHDYLAAVCRHSAPASVIDLANVEQSRHLALARSAPPLRRPPKWIEAVKARRWEPSVWRVADAVLVLSVADGETVRRAGGHAVIAFNGVDEVEIEPSPSEGYVLMVGSFTYQPNRDAAAWLSKHVWPLVQSVCGNDSLVIAGCAADQWFADHPDSGVRVVSDFDEVAPLYRGASVVAAPVSYGGGAQLKLVEAVAHQRLIVSRTYGRAGLPEDLATSGQFIFEDQPESFAASLTSLLKHPEERWRRERAAFTVGAAKPWRESLSSAVECVFELAGRPL